MNIELDSLRYLVTDKGDGEEDDYLTIKFLENLNSGILIEIWFTNNRSYPKMNRMEIKDVVRSFQELTDLVIRVINTQRE